MTDIAEADAFPSVKRVSDPNETRFYFATRKHEGAAGRIKSIVSKFYLERIGRFDAPRTCSGLVSSFLAATNVAVAAFVRVWRFIHPCEFSPDFFE